MKLKKLLLTLAVLCLLLPCLGLEADAATVEASGTLGLNLIWTLDSDGKLTIAGLGDMYYCQMETEVPWLAHSEKIKTAVIEKGVTSIGPYTFYECMNLEEVSIPDTVTKIHQDAFYWCRSLTEVTVPDAVTSIGHRAFYNCDGLTKLDLGQGVQLIGKNAFEMCRSLTEVTIPASVVSLDSYCFRSCDNLQKVTFEGSAPSIGGGVFSGDSLTCYYPANDSSWTEDVRKSYDGSVIWASRAADEEEDVATNPSGSCGIDMTWTLDLKTGVLTISGTGYMNDVASMIYSPWYSYQEQIKKVVIGEGVVSIGRCMFSGLSNMEEVSFPESLRFIKGAAFEMSTALKSIDLTGIEAVENAAFNGCTGLTEVTIPDGIELRGISGVGIGDRGIFSNCTNLAKVTVGNFTGSGANLFKNCTALTDVTLKEGMEFLSAHMFDGCTALESITIPAGADIGGAAFADCTALTTVNFDGGIGLVGEKAFTGCTSLTSIRFPGQIESLYSSVFYLSGVDTIYFRGDAPEFDRHALNNINVTIYYPAGNSTWEDKVNGHFGANIDTWVPYTVDHVYTASTTAPTCTEQGYTTFTCKDCGYSYQDNYVDPVDHPWGEWIETIPATCLTKGVERRSCETCTKFELREIAANVHTEEILEAVAPGCMLPGLTEGVRCSVCLQILKTQELVPSSGHTLGEWAQTSASTCTRQGVERRDCENCDYYETQRLELAPHTEQTVAAVAATCTEAGKTQGMRCSVCEAVLTAQEPVAALGHSWDAGVITTEPAEGSAGIRTYTCTVCQETKTEEVPALDHVHDYVAVIISPTCETEGYTLHTCACGDRYKDTYVDTAEHSYSLWTQVTASTCTEQGQERRVCLRCGHEEVRESELKDHFYGLPEFVWNDDNSCTITRVCSRCGETQIINGTVTSETTPATPTEDGKIVYTVTIELGGEIYTDSITIPIPATGTTLLWGDVNADGVVDSYDAALILKYDVMLIGDSDLDLSVADVSGDGFVDSYDASLILKYDVMLIDKFPVEE